MKPYEINKLKELKDFCRSINKKVFLANNIKLALTLKFDGVYIPSFNKKINLNINKSVIDFTIMGSAHNIREIKIKENQGVDIIFIAPLFFVKKSKTFLNVPKFNILTFVTNKKIIALGGINNQNIKKLNIVRANGFAGISYFQKKNGPKKRGRLNILKRDLIRMQMLR